MRASLALLIGSLVGSALVAPRADAQNFVWAVAMKASSQRHNVAVDGLGNSYAVYIEAGVEHGLVRNNLGIVGTRELYGCNNRVAIDGHGNVDTLAEDCQAPFGNTQVCISSFEQSQYTDPFEFPRWITCIGSGVSLGGVASDAGGNLYVVGHFDRDAYFGSYFLRPHGTTGQDEAFIAKLDSDGNVLWAKQLGGPQHDHAVDVAVDAADNVYTVGTFEGTADFDPGAGTSNMTSVTYDDVFISKLDTNGNAVWAKQVGANQSQASVAVDDSGNVYTVGNFYGTVDFDPGPGTTNLTAGAGGTSYVLKLNTNGDFISAGQLGGAANDVSMGPGGIVAIVGTFSGTADFDPGPGTYNLMAGCGCSFDAFVVILDDGGHFANASRWGDAQSCCTSPSCSGGEQSHASATGVALDASGNVSIVGSFDLDADFDPGPGIYLLYLGGVCPPGFMSKLTVAAVITASAGPGGSISPGGSVVAPFGRDKAFTVAPDICRSIADVRVDGVSVGAVSSYTFTNVQTHHTIAATFANGPNGIACDDGNTCTVHDTFCAGVCGGICYCTEPASGLVGWWPGDGNASDISGGGHNGTLMNGATYAPGTVGQGFVLDGVDDYIVVPDAPDLTPSSFTLDAWVAPSGIASGIILSKYDSHPPHTNGVSWILDLMAGKLRCYVYGNASGTEYRGAESIAPVLVPGVFQHVAATFDQGSQSLRLYVNGSEVPTTLVNGGSSVVSPYDSTTPVRIGAAIDASGSLAVFPGKIDEPTIYNRALGATEIRTIYDAGDQGVCKNCTDADGDGYGLSGETCHNGSIQDCAPGNAAVWQVPGEATTLHAAKTTPAGSVLLSWAAPVNPGTTAAMYDVIRSANPADFVGGSAACVLTNDPGAQVVDSAIPPAGGAYYYLSRAEDSCGAGIAGTSWNRGTSTSAPTLARTCP